MTVKELFGKQMTMPRLILKLGVEALLVWNFWKYATEYATTSQDPPWECFSTGYRQPNPVGDGENMSAAFTQLCWFGFYLAVIALVVGVVELVNKFAKIEPLTYVVNIADSVIVLAAAAWLVWCYTVRLSQDGKICAGATTNVTGPTKPYAYEQGSMLVTLMVIMTIVPVALFVATNCGCL